MCEPELVSIFIFFAHLPRLALMIPLPLRRSTSTSNGVVTAEPGHITIQTCASVLRTPIVFRARLESDTHTPAEIYGAQYSLGKVCVYVFFSGHLISGNCMFQYMKTHYRETRECGARNHRGARTHFAPKGYSTGKVLFRPSPFHLRCSRHIIMIIRPGAYRCLARSKLAEREPERRSCSCLSVYLCNYIS